MRISTIVLLALLIVPLAGCATLDDDPTAQLQNADITARTAPGGDVVEEYRIAGQLRVVKITPRRGPTYYLVDSDGDGKLDSSKGEGPISPVQYKLLEW
ncbi:MAG TPA: DUF2782 domain-containing protein [Lysobacter sp.]